MAIATFILIIPLIAVLVVCIGAILLQIYLSKKENRLLGLILPLLTLLNSLLAILSLSKSYSYSGPFWAAIQTFLIMNIPTAILIFIYFLCQHKQNRKKLLEKMNIQDLE